MRRGKHSEQPRVIAVQSKTCCLKKQVCLLNTAVSAFVALLYKCHWLQRVAIQWRLESSIGS